MCNSLKVFTVTVDQLNAYLLNKNNLLKNVFSLTDPKLLNRSVYALISVRMYAYNEKNTFKIFAFLPVQFDINVLYT